LQIDFGGGLKSDEDLRIAFESGANQITGGSIAVKNKEIFQKFARKKVCGLILITVKTKRLRYESESVQTVSYSQQSASDRS
jgi:phosphoribosylformimino-5-aminoimidazole carboxamide ribotide isomerase